MPFQSLQFENILHTVEKPSRYLGTEVNGIRKDGEGFLRIGLAFPDLYEIGSSHFGLQILYDILNREEAIAAERIYLPAPDMAGALRKNRFPLTTLESRTPLAELDILGFSLLYELNYTGVLEILDLAGLPFYAKDRGENHPLVIAGGPCVCNPEPMAPFFDLMLMGDGEEQLLHLCRMVTDFRNRGGKDRRVLLKNLAALDGVYVPSFYEASWDTSGFQHLFPGEGLPLPVRKAVLSSFESASTPLKPVLPFTNPVHDRLRLEIARGCTRGCRFCQAGILYRPVRERSMEKLLSIAETALKATGYDEISLLSLSTGDYSCLGGLMEGLMEKYGEEKRSISLPSIRAGRLTPNLMEQIRKVRKTGFTIAPEAGSQRLRDVINKNITEEDIVTTVQNAISLGWNQIKLYFMIGLPTEKKEDLEALVTLTDKLRKFRTPQGKWGQIVVSIGVFIPKPHAPFQWAGMISLDEALEKFRFLKEKLRMPGVQLKWQDPNTSRLEALFSRGDRKLAPLLVRAWEKGCILDGWSDFFRKDFWKAAIEEEGLNPDFYVTRERSLEEPLPWDIMDVRVSKDFLRKEWHRAFLGEATPDCRTGACTGCGICDFQAILPEVFEESAPPPKRKASPEILFRSVSMDFEKTGPARFFGHLEMVQVFLKALRMAEVPMKFSAGFHPKPEIRFDDTLPLGMTSFCEVLTLETNRRLGLEGLHERINAFLPQGLKIIRCRPTDKEEKTPEAFLYEIRTQEPLDSAPLVFFLEKKEWIVEKVSKKDKTTSLDLKDFIGEINLKNTHRLLMVLKARDGRSLRPMQVLQAVWGKETDEARQVEILKISPFRYEQEAR